MLSDKSSPPTGGPTSRGTAAPNLGDSAAETSLRSSETSAASAAQTSLRSSEPSAAPAAREAAAIAIAGMGLIGGSFYKAAKRAGYDVVGFDKGDVVDVHNADVIFVALAPQIAIDWIRLHAGEFKEGAIVVDTCGVKSAICAAFAPNGTPRPWTFVGGHPMAGKEVSGFANSDADLFRGASMILTPYPGTPPDVIDRLRALFADLGFGGVAITDPAFHDEIIAYTSQLCHIVSSAYLRDGLATRHDGFSAGSFRDLTRVGAPDPTLWSELFLVNRDALLPVLDRFISRLAAFREAIAANDRPTLASQLAEGADVKAQITNKGKKN